jgi:hypothetical protein
MSDVGKLVMKRVRWGLNANRLGMIIEESDNKRRVMWKQVDRLVFTWHDADALLDISEAQTQSVEKRCGITKQAI